LQGWSNRGKVAAVAEVCGDNQLAAAVLRRQASVGQLWRREEREDRLSGKFYEELEPGMVFTHDVRRTVTETDNLLFSVLAHNDQPLHLDEEFGKKSIYGTRVVNSLWTLSFVTGISVRDTTLGTTIGNLGYDEIRFPRPVRIGDTLHGETHIVAKRESGKHPNAGIVTFRHIGYNQQDEIVVTAIRAGMMLKKPVGDP